MLTREDKAGHGTVARKVVPAGTGMVDWSEVFAELARVGYAGPVSIHCEFEEPEGQFVPTFAREVAFFRGQRAKVTS